MTKFSRCFTHETRFYEDRIHPNHLVSLYLTGPELDKIADWAESVLDGSCRIKEIDFDCTSDGNIIYHHVMFCLSNEDDILTFKLAWG